MVGSQPFLSMLAGPLAYTFGGFYAFIDRTVDCQEMRSEIGSDTQQRLSGMVLEPSTRCKVQYAPGAHVVCTRTARSPGGYKTVIKKFSCITFLFPRKQKPMSKVTYY